MSKEKSVGFVGAGQMARALAQGICQQGLLPSTAIWATDVAEQARDQFQTLLPGCRTVTDTSELVQQVDTVVIAVKPQHAASACHACQSGITTDNGPLFVSIVAGLPLRQLADWLGSDRVVRVMPNTPCLVGAGASAYCGSAQVDRDDRTWVAQMLEAVGTAVELPEDSMNVVTGLSGSGPAYVFLMIEALADGGVLQGLPRPIALQLATQTVLGSAQLVAETGDHPAVLRDRVTSPGGTTIHGLQALESGGFRAAVIAAIEAATNRADELG